MFKLHYINSTSKSISRVNQWGMHVVELVFTPSLYILLQAVTSTPVYTMEVNSSFRKIKKFNRRPSTISLREFKVTFSIVVLNWSSSMALITSTHSHSNNWPIMCTMRHWMSTNNIFRRFWTPSRSPIQLVP